MYSDGLLPGDSGVAGFDPTSSCERIGLWSDCLFWDEVHRKAAIGDWTGGATASTTNLSDRSDWSRRSGGLARCVIGAKIGVDEWKHSEFRDGRA
jgi:hypothetical protein